MADTSGLEPIQRDGELILYASKDMAEGVVLNERSGAISPRMDLQVFYKWGHFEPIEETPEGSPVEEGGP